MEPWGDEVSHSNMARKSRKNYCLVFDEKGLLIYLLNKNELVVTLAAMMRRTELKSTKKENIKRKNKQ